MKSRLPQPRYNKYNIEIIQVLSNNKQPATLSEMAQQVKLKYNKITDPGFWKTFDENISIGVSCGYIRIDQWRCSLVDPLPTVEELMSDIRKRIGR